MSHKGELGGQVASTAISSVAVQAGGSQITVAVLQVTAPRSSVCLSKPH